MMNNKLINYYSYRMNKLNLNCYSKSVMQNTETIIKNYKKTIIKFTIKNSKKLIINNIFFE